nr:phage tail protein [Sphingomonas endophytica]
MRASPETLSIFVDRGRVAARAGSSLSFEYRYTANLVVQDFAGSPDQIVVPLLAWIARHQPDLIAKPNGEPITFEAELLDADRRPRCRDRRRRHRHRRNAPPRASGDRRPGPCAGDRGARRDRRGRRRHHRQSDRRYLRRRDRE